MRAVKTWGKRHGDLGLSREQTRFDEAPLIMLIPLLVAATTVLVIGVYNQEVVNQIERSYGLTTYQQGLNTNDHTSYS